MLNVLIAHKLVKYSSSYEIKVKVLFIKISQTFFILMEKKLKNV